MMQLSNGVQNELFGFQKDVTRLMQSLGIIGWLTTIFRTAYKQHGNMLCFSLSFFNCYIYGTLFVFFYI